MGKNHMPAGTGRKRGAAKGKSNAEGEGFYARVLDEAELIDFEMASGVEGIDDEVISATHIEFVAEQFSNGVLTPAVIGKVFEMLVNKGHCNCNIESPIVLMSHDLYVHSHFGPFICESLTGNEC